MTICLLCSQTGYVSDVDRDGSVAIWPSGVVISTEMGDRSPFLVCCQPLRPTQPPALNWVRNEYRTKCRDALRMGTKDAIGMAHFTTCGLNVWEAGKSVISR